MSTYTDCLKDVVGLSRNQCICYNAGNLPEYSVSRSGLYMDDYLFGLPLSYPAALFECDQNDLWLLMSEAREQGIHRFMSEFGQAIVTNGYRKNYPSFNGFIGGQKKLGNVGASVFHVMEIAPRFDGSTVKINSIIVRGTDLIPGTATVFLLDEEMMSAGDTSAPIETYTGSFDASGTAKCTPLATTVEALDCDTSDSFFLVWSNNNERNPFKIAMERSTPRCCTQPAAIAIWDQYISASTFATDDLTTWNSAQNDNAFTQGIQAQTSLTCDAMFLCDEIDFENDPFGRAVANLILLYANRQLIGHMLVSDKVNVYTAARSEEIIERDVVLKEEIISRIGWPSRNLPAASTSCYICNPRQRRIANLV